MKVKELRKALRGLDGELEVIVRTESDEPGSAYVGTIGSASYQYGCDGKPFFAIDCGEEDQEGDERAVG